MRKFAMEAKEKNIHLKEVLKENKEIAEKIELESFNFEYTGKAEEIVEVTIQKLREELPEIGL